VNSAGKRKALKNRAFSLFVVLYGADGSVLVPSVGFFVLAAVDVAVEHGEPGKEGDADQVFHTFDVLVVIDQGVDFLELSYGVEEFVHGFILSRGCRYG
jgi:hypothetical protein